VDDRPARRLPPAAALKARLRSSPRIVSLYRGARGFVLGGEGRDATGRGRSSVEDGVRLLPRAGLTSSPRTGYRLNLVLSTVDAARTFGGIRTALDLFEAIAGGVRERRIVSVGKIGSVVDETLAAYRVVPSEADPSDPLQVVSLGLPGATLAVRADDVFVATFWTTADLVLRIRRWQVSTYGSAPPRCGYVIQDFEPGFYPWSAQWMLARSTYGDAAGTIGIFNTSVLRDYFHATGIRFATEHTFEPRLLPTLRSAIASPAVARSRTIVVYGRPGTPRNAFPAIIDGLRAWRASHGNADAWRLVSVGQAHPDIDLGGDVVLRSIGKLDIPAYASLLREAAIGISLMISPHPSYPPLEMGHLGLLVLTNRFGGKDPSSWHSNIRSIDDVSAASIATALSELCRQFEADPDAGSKGRSGRPDYTSDEPQFPFAVQLAADFGSGVGRRDGGLPPE
jgi:O-antigen biosynthesis protein